MRISGHPDPKAVDAAVHLSHGHHQEVELWVVQPIPKDVHSTGQATNRGNKPNTPQDMGRNRVHASEKTHEDETQGVMTGNDIESPFDRIEESFSHHLDCIQQPHFDDIHNHIASKFQEASPPSQTKAGGPVKRNRHKNCVSKKSRRKQI